MYLQDSFVLKQVHYNISFVLVSQLINPSKIHQIRPPPDLKTSFHDFETTEALNKSSRSRNENTVRVVDRGCFTASPKYGDLGSAMGDIFFERRAEEMALASAIIDLLASLAVECG